MISKRSRKLDQLLYKHCNFWNPNLTLCVGWSSIFAYNKSVQRVYIISHYARPFRKTSFCGLRTASVQQQENRSEVYISHSLNYLVTCRSLSEVGQPYAAETVSLISYWKLL